MTTLLLPHLTLEALDPPHLPPFKGSALGGGFGHSTERPGCFQPVPGAGWPWGCLESLDTTPVWT